MNIKEKILEIKKRGLIKDETDFNKIVNIVKQKKTVYCGIDPTCDSLHIGHLVPLKLMKELNDLGCPVIIVVGSVTAKIGDPSFISKSRKNIELKILEENIKKIKIQIYKLFSNVKILDNKEWYEKMTIISFFNKMGKLFTVNKMLERKSIKEANTNGVLFYDNFSYILMQAYDFYYLWKNYNVGLQVGGSDQLPNIIFGIETINKLEKKNNIEIAGLTTPLLMKSAGKKFSKTDDKNIWIDSKKTRLYDLYQFIYNISDENIEIWKKIFISNDHNEFKNEANNIKKELGFYLIEWITGDNVLKNKIKYVLNIINSKDYSGINFKIFEEVLGVIKINENINLIDVLIKSNFFNSTSEVKRLIKQNGIKLFDKKIDDFEYKITKKDSKDNYILLKKGKNNIFLFKFI